MPCLYSHWCSGHTAMLIKSRGVWNEHFGIAFACLFIYCVQAGDSTEVRGH